MQIVKFQTLCTAIIVLNLGGLSMAAEKGKMPGKEEKQGTVHTVTASMDYPTNAGVGIQAEKRPGEFTIPKGSKGTKLKYNFFNPKSGNTLTKINGRNIYSVTEKRYMHELDKNPDFELPPGDYKFVVGGEPGATGTLAYTTVPSNDENPPPKTTPPHGTTKRKPTEKTDKTEDTNTVTVVPGGARRKKVVVDFFEAQKPCKREAYLTIDNNKIVLDFIMPDVQEEFYVTKDTMRWEGVLERNDKAATATGTVNIDSTTNFKSGDSARLTMKGSFKATLKKNILSGSTEEEGQVQTSSGGTGSIKSKTGWRIEGFSP